MGALPPGSCRARVRASLARALVRARARECANVRMCTCKLAASVLAGRVMIIAGNGRGLGQSSRGCVASIPSQKQSEMAVSLANMSAAPCVTPGHLQHGAGRWLAARKAAVNN